MKRIKLQVWQKMPNKLLMYCHTARIAILIMYSFSFSILVKTRFYDMQVTSFS